MLHAALEEQGLFLWGEGGTSDWRRPARGGSPPSHPGGVGADRLRAGLALTAGGADPIESVLWLPSDERAPRPSGGAGGSGLAGEGAALRPWRVEGLAVTPWAALPLLAEAQSRTVLADGTHVGAGLSWLGAVLRVAAAAVARQAMVPDLVEAESGVFRARWRPVWSDEEHASLAALARTMPGAVRALGDAGRAPEALPEALTRALAADLADAIVRRSLPGRGAKDAGGPPESLWLAGLTRRDGLLALKPADGRALLERVRDWQRPVFTTVGAAVRVRLRLEEPETGDASWRLAYLVHPADDPSLLVPAEDLWRKGAVTGRVAERLPRAREILLQTLGRIGPLCPPIERSLAGGRPTSATLDLAEAYHFLHTTAAVVAQSGVAVLLPAWWNRPRARLRLTAEARARTAGAGAGAPALGADSLVDVDFGVALGDDAVSDEELTELARLKAPLVRLRGQWVEVDPARVAAMLRVRRPGGVNPRTVAEVARLALGIERLPGGLELDALAGEGGLGTLLSGLREPQALAPLPIPETFRGQLRPYQERGYAWLSFLTGLGLGALLADDMGLGKTVQTLCLLVRLYEQDPSRRFLLCCPTSLLGNWRREAERFAPTLPVHVHHGGERGQGAGFASAPGGGLVLTSYGILVRDRALLGGVEWAALVLDEAQAVKNHRTQASQAARALRSERRIALTGTPVQNHVGDLWSIMEFLQPGALGGESAFREEFLLPVQGDPHGPAAERLRRRTAPLILRRVKSDRRIIADLPDKLEMKVVCTITPEQASLYRAVLDRLEDAVSGAEPGIQRQGLVLSTLTQLKQVVDHPALFLGDSSALAGRSGKLERLEEMLAEILDNGERALVFTQFAAMAELLRRRLEAALGREVMILTGETAPRDRDRLVARFQAQSGGPPILVLTLGAGGTGLNLTAASHVFHYDRWWNPAVENQATDRVHRIGQRRAVEVHKFLCGGTLEERIDALLEHKGAVAQTVVGSGEGWLATLDTGALLDVLRLDSAQAVGP